ncbi:MAG: hypothetical protein GX162_02840 [Firmicutes bacterium]|jgi:multiple sugar transport system substrate-binding protein|nr:hypothetical protein [Bacillota bacterium]
MPGARTTNAATAEFTDYDVQVTPIGPNGRRFTTVVPNVWVLNRHSTPERQEAAWNWIKFVLSPQAQAFRALRGYGVPVNREAGVRFLNMPGLPKNRIAFLESFTFAETLEENAVWGVWSREVYQLLEPMYRGQESVRSAVEKAHSRLTAILAEAFGAK